MQTYEYYEAHAKDVKLQDITSDEWNEDVLERVRDNDPDLKRFFIVTGERDNDREYVVREGDHLGWLGYFVGRNDTLRTLDIISKSQRISIYMHSSRDLATIDRLKNLKST